jgi:hypothetical protein
VKRAWRHELKVLMLLDRASGQARSTGVDDLKVSTVTAILQANISHEARLITGEAGRCVSVGRTFAEHGTTNHQAEEYVSPTDPTVHSNTVEGYFSVFKRSMKGPYKHCASIWRSSISDTSIPDTMIGSRWEWTT